MSSLPRAAAGVVPVHAFPLHPNVFRVGERPTSAVAAQPSGFAALDRELPGGGWPCAGLVDIACDAWGIGEMSLVMPGLAVGLKAREAHALWILPPCAARQMSWVPYAPGLVAQGIALDQLALVRPPTVEEGLWCAEQALRSGAVAYVLIWLDGQRLPSLALKRLQQAAMGGGAAAFVFRPLASLDSPSPAPLRLALHAGAQGTLRVELVKRRGLPDGHAVLLTPRSMACLARPAAAVPSPAAWQPPRRRDVLDAFRG
ncbi:MAG: translesion DNA synthesis-associated protein ImuA [Betaproteobacteria bacterium]|nr:translesion DNA synthesis-associated protein ImuA [Betaproteobacteria bacterium]